MQQQPTTTDPAPNNNISDWAQETDPENTHNLTPRPLRVNVHNLQLTRDQITTIKEKTNK